MYACVCLFVMCVRDLMSQQEGAEKDEGGILEQRSAGVGWVVGDSREEAMNSSSPGSLSDLNTNTDVPLILV